MQGRKQALTMPKKAKSFFSFSNSILLFYRNIITDIFTFVNKRVLTYYSAKKDIIVIKKGGVMEREKWQSRSAKLFCAALVFVGAYLLLKYALGAFLPFLAALAASLPVISLSRLSAEKLGGSRKAWGRFYILLFWLTVFFGAGLLFKWIIVGIGKFAEYLSENSAIISETVENALITVTELPLKIPILGKLIRDGGELAVKAEQAFFDFMSEAGGKISASIASFAAMVAVGTPKAFLGTVVAVIASFYMCSDTDGIVKRLGGLLPKDKADKAREIARRMKIGFKAYLKAYALLFCINFFMLWVGLALLGREYPFLISLLLALLDLLPLFGASAVIAVWGAFLLIVGNTATGLGMIALAATVGAVRQIAEPRLVGKGIGIHPLFSLAAMYIGFRFFGFWGMVLAPIAILAVKEARKGS